MENGRRNQGFPSQEVVNVWLDEGIKPKYPGKRTLAKPEIKNSEIPELDCYKEDPRENFWKQFPERKLPAVAGTEIIVDKLVDSVNKVRNKMTKTEIRRAEKVISDLKMERILIKSPNCLL